MFGEPTYFFLDGCEFSAKSRLVLASGFRISITDHAAASTTLKSSVNDHFRQEKNTCTVTDRIMDEKKRFNLQAPPVYDRKVTNFFFP